MVELHPAGERLTVDRVVTLPVLTGPAIDGLPHDAAGFLPVDEHGQVLGALGVFAAGDATAFTITQGGIACQQADAAAEAIAARAGAAISPNPFAPVLRGILLTECQTRWLQRDLSSPHGGIGSPRRLRSAAVDQDCGARAVMASRPPARPRVAVTRKGRRPRMRTQVVIVGAGVAGLEALLALRAVLGDRVDLTIVAPGSFVRR